MALITCAECGREISDLAASCVNCGAPVGVKNESAPTEQKPSDGNATKADLAQKPMFWLLSVVTAVGAAWSGSYGVGTLSTIGRADCAYLAFNKAESASFERAFLCLNEAQKTYYSGISNIPGFETAIPGPYLPHIPFALAMTAVSIGLWSLVWRFVRKARAAK